MIDVRNSLILLFFSVFAFLLTVIIATNSFANTSEPKKTLEKQKKEEPIALLYPIAISLLGAFSIYNAVESHKTKAQFLKEINELLDKQKNSIHSFEIQNKDTLAKLAKIKIDIERFELEISKKNKKSLEMMADEIQQRERRHNDNLELNFSEILDRLRKEQDKIKKTTLKNFKILKAYRKEMIYDLSRLSYSFQLHTLIPNKLDKKTWRAEVTSAICWFSQEGLEEDLEILDDLIGKVPPSDTEIRNLIDKAASEIKDRVLT